MNGFLQLSQRLQSLNLLQEIEALLDEMDERIITLVQGQLAEGKRGDGSLMPKYSHATKLIKQQKGRTLIGERVSLIDTGAFWKGFFATAYGGGIEVDSKEWKRDFLIERYGEEIFQVSTESLEQIVEEIFPKLQKRVHDYING